MRWPWSRRTSPKTADDTPYIMFKGRRMKVDSPYMLPKDHEESGRLDLQHIMLRYVLKGNFLAPVRNPQSILDVGCGTGRWGAELAQQFPQANVIGVDIAPPSATSASVTQGQMVAPDNYVFEAGDVTTGLPFPDDSFDFVHMRLVVLALPYAQWLPAIQELRRITKPGGWIELVDTTVTSRSPAAQQWMKWAQTLASYRGIDLTAGDQIGTFLKRAGMRTVTEIPIEIPLGPWGGRIGNLMLADALAGARALETPVLMTKLATKADFDAAMTAMEQDMRTTPGITQPFFIAYGQK